HPGVDCHPVRGDGLPVWHRLPVAGAPPRRAGDGARLARMLPRPVLARAKQRITGTAGGRGHGGPRTARRRRGAARRRRRVRARRLSLLPAPLFYYLAVLFVAALASLPAVVLLTNQSQGATQAALVTLGLALLFLSFSILSVGYLALTFATPSIVLAVSRGGIAGGLRVDGVMRSVRRSLVNTLIAGLMLIAAHFVASLGLFVC